MSWEGHFWGLFIGLVMAIYYRKRGPQRKKYSWEIEAELEEENEDNKVEEMEYVYHFVPKKEEGKES